MGGTKSAQHGQFKIQATKTIAAKNAGRQEGLKFCTKCAHSDANFRIGTEIIPPLRGKALRSTVGVVEANEMNIDDTTQEEREFLEHFHSELQSEIYDRDLNVNEVELVDFIKWVAIRSRKTEEATGRTIEAFDVYSALRLLEQWGLEPFNGTAH